IMHVMVRIGMGGCSADQLDESCELALEFGRNPLGCARIQLEMDANAQGTVLARKGGRLFARRSIHHQAGARKAPLAMRLTDPAIDSAGNAEVVRRDDQPSHIRPRSSRGGRSAEG